MWTYRRQTNVCKFIIHSYSKFSIQFHSDQIHFTLILLNRVFAKPSTSPYHSGDHSGNTRLWSQLEVHFVCQSVNTVLQRINYDFAANFLSFRRYLSRHALFTCAENECLVRILWIRTGFDNRQIARHLHEPIKVSVLGVMPPVWEFAYIAPVSKLTVIGELKFWIHGQNCQASRSSHHGFDTVVYA